MDKRQLELVIKDAEEFVRPLSPEELEQTRKDLKYPGLPSHIRTNKAHRNNQSFSSGIQIKLGWFG